MSRQNDILADEQEPILFEDADYFLPYPKAQIRLELHTGEKREQLKQSIINNGVIEPILAMPSKEQRGKLVVICGHNRVDICKELGIKVPYRLKVDISEDEADLLCIETNLLQRQIDEIKISQLAFILKTRRDAMAHQGTSGQDVQMCDDDMTDNASGQDVQRHTSEIIASEYKLSGRQIRRYISLTRLIPSFLEDIDNGILPLTSAYILANISQENQEELCLYLMDTKYRCKSAHAEQIKSYCEDGNLLNTEVLDSIFAPKKEETPKTKITFKQKELSQYIPQNDIDNAKDIIIEALKLYYKTLD